MAVSCKYVHLFVNELDADQTKPGYVLQSVIVSHFCSVALTYLTLSFCLVLFLCRLSRLMNKRTIMPTVFVISLNLKLCLSFHCEINTHLSLNLCSLGLLITSYTSVKTVIPRTLRGKTILTMFHVQ